MHTHKGAIGTPLPLEKLAADGTDGWMDGRGGGGKTVFAQGFELKVPKPKGGGVWFWALLMRILK